MKTTKKTTATGTHTIKPAVTELERIYKRLAPRFTKLGIAAPHPVITIQSKGKAPALAWMAPKRWQNGQPEAINEINICAEHLGRSDENIVETMLHEMVHHFNFSNNKIDCSSNQYHNKKFAKLADAVGLEVAQMGRFGYACTKPSEELKTFTKKLNIKAEAFSLFRKPIPSQRKQPTRMKKWACGCTIVRCAVNLDATCNVCGEDFVRA